MYRKYLKNEEAHPMHTKGTITEKSPTKHTKHPQQNLECTIPSFTNQ